jgi:uncharacterized membrane-anchored protein YitT (DUF2179 family)
MPNIESHRITKPIQLLGAWLAGLAIVNSTFLYTATQIDFPSWIPAMLSIAAVANVPLFLFSVFLLQTKFRPEMLEDVYYSKFISAQKEPSAQPVPAGQIPVITDDLVAQFLRVSSMNGLKVLLACKLGYERGRAFDLKMICDADGQMSFDYAFAYLVAANSIGFLMNASVGNIVRITEYSAAMRNQLEGAINGRIQFVRDTQRNLQGAAAFEADVNKIRSYIAALS